MEGVSAEMLESKLESDLGKEVRKLGGMSLKFVSPGMAGVPDRLILLPNGVSFFVEVKKPGEHLRPLQKKMKQIIEDLGYFVEVVDSPESLRALINRWGGSFD